jgi:hypothetical protein
VLYFESLALFISCVVVRTEPRFVQTPIRDNAPSLAEELRELHLSNEDCLRRCVPWSDKLEDERIALIELEEERDLTSKEASRLDFLMRASSESRRSADREGIAKNLDELDQLIAKLNEFRIVSATGVLDYS